MNAEAPRTAIFFDGECHLCSREIDHYRNARGADRLQFIDISDPHFDAERWNLDRRQVRKHLHVRRADGSVVKGVEAFASESGTRSRPGAPGPAPSAGRASTCSPAPDASSSRKSVPTCRSEPPPLPTGPARSGIRSTPTPRYLRWMFPPGSASTVDRRAPDLGRPARLHVRRPARDQDPAPTPTPVTPSADPLPRSQALRVVPTPARR